MKNRLLWSRLSLTFCFTMITGLAAFGCMTKTSTTTTLAAITEDKKPFRHHRPFAIRIKNDGSVTYTQSTTVTVKYTDNGSAGKQADWKVLNPGNLYQDAQTLLLLLQPKDPRKPVSEGGDGLGPSGQATGTGYIIITTTGPDSGSGQIPVSAIDTQESP